MCPLQSCLTCCCTGPAEVASWGAKKRSSLSGRQRCKPENTKEAGGDREIVRNIPDSMEASTTWREQTREGGKGKGGGGGSGGHNGEHLRSCRPQHYPCNNRGKILHKTKTRQAKCRERRRSTVKPYRAVKPLAVILLWVRFRLHSCDKRAKCPRAASVMPTLCARDREVREGMREMTAAPTSVTRPPHTSRDSSFCRFLHQTQQHTLTRGGLGGGGGWVGMGNGAGSHRERARDVAGMSSLVTCARIPPQTHGLGKFSASDRIDADSIGSHAAA